MTVTIFSWGYWGWGNATEQLVKAFDAAESKRGFEPPFFVDIRLKRSGRAKGFVGKAFEHVVGPSHYRWIEDLGNDNIASGKSGVKIKNPAAIADLLREAVDRHRNRQRVLFFCACEYPRVDGELACHRETVTELLLTRAAEDEQSIQVVEWPGGEPELTRLSVSSETVSTIRRPRGRRSVPLDDLANLGAYAGLPWGSVVRLESSTDSVHVATGPARYHLNSQRGQWVLPLLPGSEPGEAEELARQAQQFRKAHGLYMRE